MNLNKILTHSTRFHQSESIIPEWSPNHIVEDLKDPTLVSATLEINQRSKELESEGFDICKVGFGESPFPIPSSVVEELKINAHRNAYENIQGIDILRESIIEHLEDRFDFSHFHMDNVMVGVGSKSILADIVKVLDCEVILCSPAWVSYRPQSVLSRKNIQYIHTKVENNHWPTAEEIEEVCKNDPTKRRVMIFNSPSNPTGRMATNEEMKDLVPVLEKYKIIVISDEIYSLFHANGDEPTSMAHFYPERTIVCNGLSKVVGGGGWRLGFGAFPESLSFIIPVMQRVASHYYSCVAAPIQYASVKAFSMNEEIDEYLRLCRNILDPLRDYVYEELIGIGTVMVKPNSAFYGYPLLYPFAEEMEEEFGIRTGEDLSKVLLEIYGVAVLPGTKFSRDDSEFGMRLCFTAFDGEKALEIAGEYERMGKEIDKEFLDNYCTKVVVATERIVDFINRCRATKMG